MRGATGLITACITPFDGEEVDYAGLRELLERQIFQGASAILVLGTTGEPSTLSDEERAEIIKIAVDAGKGTTSVWVGTGTNCTKTTIAHTIQAEKLGADAALIVTPYYNCPTQEGIYQHMRRVHDNTSLPICLYNVPKRTGVAMETATILRLAELSRIAALKDATGNLNQLQELISIFEGISPLSLLCGDDSLAFPMIALGAQGLVSVASNLIPGAMARLIHLIKNENFIEARDLHFALFPLFKALFVESNPIPIKAAMNLWDLPAGPCRLPLTPMSDAALKSLAATLQMHEHLCPTGGGMT